MSFIIVSIVLTMSGCADHDTTSEYVSYPLGNEVLELSQYRISGFDFDEATKAINLAFPEYCDCVRLTLDWSNVDRRRAERNDCQVMYLPRRYWSRTALVYELDHVTNLLIEASNLK
jgi:hypothetical protein